jgi:Leucine-rich repeat (LRR) protein
VANSYGVEEHAWRACGHTYQTYVGYVCCKNLLSFLQHELNLKDCRLMALPEGVGALTRLKKLDLRYNGGLTALPEGLWSLAGLEELKLAYCDLTALPEGIGRLTGLKKLDLRFNHALTALPAGLGRLRNLEQLKC